MDLDQASATASKQVTSELGPAQDVSFSATGMESLNRDEAVQKMAAVAAKGVLSTPARPQDPSKKGTEIGHSASKGKTQKSEEKAAPVKRTPPPRK